MSKLRPVETLMRAANKRPLLRLFSVLALAVLALPADPAAQPRWKNRDAWQRPAEVMDALGIVPGSVVADVGAGEGYFTFLLAERVGAQGKVYAQDIDDSHLAKIRERLKREKLEQVEIVLGDEADPRLPRESLDAVLVVNAYHEMRSYDAMLRGMYRALKPGGRLAIIDREDEPGRPRESYFGKHRVPEAIVLEDAARNGFRFLRKEPGFIPEKKDKWFFLIFEKPTS